VAVGVADTVSSALACIGEKNPDVALLDFAMHDALSEDEVCECAEAGIAGYVARMGLERI
jgi:hypothetical protein